MNESTQLKIIVERAVRHVQASFARKRKMREELLAHVSGVFEEELAKLGDERTALQRTAQRFGKPTEVREQLQAAIPAGDVIDRLLSGHRVKLPCVLPHVSPHGTWRSAASFSSPPRS
jgi:hypothetical protein